MLLLTCSAVAADNKTRATLLLAAEAARPGDSVLAAVRLQMSPGWHTYWRNPGESGLATTIEWTLPAGVTAGDIQWPPPETYVTADLTTYVYHDDVLLLVPLKLAPDLKPGRLSLKARVDWLECEVACVPGGATVTAALEVAAAARPSANAALIETWQKRIPQPNPALQTRASWERPPAGDAGTLVLEGQALADFQPTDFYAYPGEGYEISPAVNVLSSDGGHFRLSKTIKRLDQAFPAKIAGILVQVGKAGPPAKAFEVTLDLPAAAAGAPESTNPPMASAAVGEKAGLLAMLGLAFLGGLILNVMPCVLPVIALKVLGFVQQSKEAPQRVRQLGLVYALGVLASFLVLAGIVIQVQHAGGNASWGMQMQNPYFRLALLVVVMLVALNLFGVFEVTLPGSAMGAAAGLAAKEGVAGAFFNGVLATALATPCTAPFLAVALGFAFTQPAWVTVLIFTAVALGLAAPYVLLSWQPGWLKFLPKPGAWMLRFKVAMGFPMLATAIWLFDLTAPSFGEGGVLWLGLALALLALTAWVWGEFVQRAARHRPFALGLCLALLAFNYAYILEAQLHWRSPQAAEAGAEVVKDSPDGIEWHRWSPEAVQVARESGHPTLVDFTAKWCLTCKSNKRLAVDIPAVRSRLKALNAIAFRADDTDPNPLIAAELKRFGRAGVPLTLVFPADVSKPPIILPENLWMTPGAMLDALAKIGPPTVASQTE